MFFLVCMHSWVNLICHSHRFTWLHFPRRILYEKQSTRLFFSLLHQRTNGSINDFVLSGVRQKAQSFDTLNFRENQAKFFRLSAYSVISEFSVKNFFVQKNIPFRKVHSEWDHIRFSFSFYRNVITVVRILFEVKSLV